MARSNKSNANRNRKRASSITRDSAGGGDRPIAGKPNTLLRLIVPILAIGAAAAVSVAVWNNTHSQPSRQSGETQASETQANETPAEVAPGEETEMATAVVEDAETVAPTEAGDATDVAPTVVTDAAESPAPASPIPSMEAAPDPEPTNAATDAPTESPAGPSRTYSVERFEPAGGVWSAPTLGALEDRENNVATDYEAYVEFSPVGAGVFKLLLSKHYETVKREEHAVVMSEEVYAAGRLTPLAVLGVTIDGSYVSLAPYEAGEPVPVWKPAIGADGQPVPGAFDAHVLDENGDRVLRVERRYTLAPGSFELSIEQRAINLTDDDLLVRLFQTGPADLRQESFYGGDKRRVRFGYFLDPAIEPTQTFVQADERLAGRGSLLGPKTNGYYDVERQIWPTPKSEENSRTLVWTAFTNRYFAVAVHPLPPAGETLDAAIPLRVFDRVDRILADNVNGEGMVIRLVTPERALPAGAGLNFSHGVYAGPLSRPIINEDPLLSTFNLGGLVVYNLGGPCAFCTFAWITDALHFVLLFAHDHLVFDWALAIILLVVVVRTILHPVTRWSQIRMQRFGKQMQDMAPKQKKLQERYKDDPKKLQQEMGKLWREEGVNPAGMLGCLPMFLQTPVWIALYATLYYSFEMRHSPAFFGVFQTITGGAWPFLSDLAATDSFIPLPGAVNLGIAKIDAINILPFVLGIVFFIHQKYMTPPPSASMTPEQKSQQRLIRVMTVVLFPIIMYAAPSGLALYFVTNSTIAIFESRMIRSSAEKKGLLDVQPKKKKAGKPGGFLGRLYEMAEQQQKMREQQTTGPGRDQTRAQQRAMRPNSGRQLPQPKRKKK